MENNKNLLYIPFEGCVDVSGKRCVYITDMSTNITRWSKNAIDLFGFESEYIENMADFWIPRVHPDDRAAYAEDIMAVLGGRKPQHRMDYRALNANGEYVMCTCEGKLMKAQDGESTLFVGTLENHGVFERIDSITGFYNIATFIQDAKNYSYINGVKSLMVVGINRYNDINKNYGYEFGNKVLRRFSADLKNKIPEGEKFYRLDGVKFCFAFDEKDRNHTDEIFERIEAIAHEGYNIDGSHVSFSISGGVVDIDEKSINENSIHTCIGYVIDQSKRKNHGELVYFETNLLSDNKRNLEIFEEIRNSIFSDMNGFYLCYQPIIDATNDEVCGMEALVRWNKEPYGNIPPGVFIPWLEKDPCFYELGNWILRQALIDGLEIVKEKPDFIVNVNVSAEQIERSKFRESVVTILEETGFPAKNLCMELTERVMSLNLDFLRRELDYFKSLGIKIALDDFGTGVSSLNLLLELPVDHIKIDRNFVKDIIDNAVEQRIVESITHCANGLDLDICAEGIETEELKEFLKRYKIGKYQGYFYSKPITIDKFNTYLK